MLQLIRFLKGYLLIRVCGNAPERFINLCSNHQIFLWDIQIHEAYYTMKIGLLQNQRLYKENRNQGSRYGTFRTTFSFCRDEKKKGVPHWYCDQSGILADDVCPYLDDPAYGEFLYYRRCLHGFFDRKRDCAWDEEE